MQERRLEDRLLCADLVGVLWQDTNGRSREALANLEDISRSGACLQLDVPIPRGTPLRISYPKGELLASVKYCVFRDAGYFMGVKFEVDSAWSRRQFTPKHLLDLRKLVKPRRRTT